MVWMKYLTLLLALELAVTSCTSGNNNDLESRVGDAFVGRAFYSNLEQAGYAEPTTFSISADELTKGEPLTLSVNENYIYTYYYVTVNGQWQKQTFSQATFGNSNWIKSSASVSLDTSLLTEGSNYAVAYSCTKTGSNWNCHNNKWQIHQFEILPKSEESKLVPLPPIDPQCGSDQECTMNYTCVEYKCVAPEDKPGLEWCDGIDNDGDTYIDEDQLGDKTFCDRTALQPPTNYIFKKDQSYYVEAFEKFWNEPDVSGTSYGERVKNNAKETKVCELIGGNSVLVDRPYNLQRPMKALLTMYRATKDKYWLHEVMEIADSMIDSSIPFQWVECVNTVTNEVVPISKCVDKEPNTEYRDAENKENWKNTNNYAVNTGVQAWDDWLNAFAGKNGYEVWAEWVASLPTLKVVDGKEIKLLQWDNLECKTNAYNHPTEFYRSQEGEVQGLRGISELARVMSSIDGLTEEESQKAQKYYDYASQVIAFYPMFGGFPKNAEATLDRAADKRSLYIMNAYDLYQAHGDERFRYWASTTSETLLNQATGPLIDLNDFVGIYWSVKSSPGEVDPYGIMDTSHANRLAELTRYWHEEESSAAAKSMLPKAVNTFLFKIWQSDPQTKIGTKLPYPTLFNNYPDGSNPCSDPAFPAPPPLAAVYSPYALGNVVLGWHELSRYDRRVLFIMEDLTISLIEGTYVNDFSQAQECAVYQYSIKGTANQGLSLLAVAEMAFATRPQP